MRCLYTYFLLFSLAVAFLAGCDRNRTEPLLPGPEPCDLVLDLTVPQISLGTKSQYTPGDGNHIVDDPFLSNPADWKPWERALDGQGMYRLTVFLINRSEGNKLVGYRNIYYTGSKKGDIYAEDSAEGANGWIGSDGNVDPSAHYGNKAKVSFIYDNPVHKNADGESPERLVRGDYRIVVFANCSACPEVLEGQSGSDPYEGLAKKDGTKISVYSDGMMTEFNNSLDSYPDGKDIALYEDFDELYNWMLEAAIGSDGITSEFLCKPTPMPLTLVEDIELQPGMNTVSGNLLRARSRMRIALENNSDYELTVHDLSFSDNFSKENSYLFYNPDDRDRVYDISGVSKGAPNPQSGNALISFSPDTKVPARSTSLLFDGYILESRDTVNPYTYTLDLEYEGQKYSRFLLETGTAITDYTTLVPDAYYLIRSTHSATSKLYLASGTQYVEVLNAEPEDFVDGINTKYVWQIASTGTEHTYYLKTTGTTKYFFGNVNGDRYGIVPLQPTDGPTYTFSTSQTSHIAMKSNESPYDYINVHGSRGVVGGWSVNDAGSSFEFYKAFLEESDVKHTSPIVLQTIDPVTAVVSPVNTIARNDFINVLVTVSFNKDNGLFEFEVKDWNTVSGDIEFN